MSLILIYSQRFFCTQDPIINITELKEIHSEINLTVPDPILLSNLQDGLEAVRLYILMLIMANVCAEGRWNNTATHPVFLSVSQQNAKKRKLEDGGGEDKGEWETSYWVKLSILRKVCSCVFLPLSSSAWHQGLRHAWWDDEEQRKPRRSYWKGQTGDPDAHREM